jgi:SAM-dependent methyltransferase
MEPGSTLAEIARILRPGGVFAAIDCDWPPTLNWQAEVAYSRFTARVQAIGAAQGVYRDNRKWAKEDHLARIGGSGLFRYVKEIVLNSREMGDAGRLVGIALSQGSVAALLKHGLSEAEIGLADLRTECVQALGDREIPFYFSYRLRVGIK